jgi:hypothetical protein
MSLISLFKSFLYSITIRNLLKIVVDIYVALSKKDKILFNPDQPLKVLSSVVSKFFISDNILDASLFLNLEPQYEIY